MKIPEKRDDLEREDIVKMLDAQSKVLIEILKKSAKLSSSIANQAQAGIYTILERYFNSGKQISNLDDLATIIETQEGTGIEEFLDTKQRHKLAISLKTLGVGSAKLLFASNDNLNIDRLLERKIKDGRETTPVNIFFLKSLYTQDEKEFFLQVLVTELYSWMIRQGNAKEPRCVFFCDEIAPFMPAGAAKPGPKDALILLFRQARKYGVQCFIATQSPKDVDYHAYEQFNTFFIGRITSQQSMKVIERILDGFPDSSGKIKGSIESIPVLKAGQFLLVSPDNAVPLALVFTRWLISVHKTLSLDDVKKIMAGKLDDLLDKPVAPPTTKATEPEPATEPELEFIPGPDLSGGSSTEGEQTSPEQRPVAVGVNDQLTIDRAKQVLDSMNESQFSDVIEARVDCTAKIPDNFTNRLVMEKIFNRLGNIAKKDHGIDFLCDLAGKRSLPFETSKMMYYDETKTLIMANLAEIKGDRLAFTFQPMLNEILEELSITKDDRAGVNQPRLEAIFYKLIATPNLKKRLKF
nr:hypothetical protein [Candidatus Sigynarchaeota archaeon]